MTKNVRKRGRWLLSKKHFDWLPQRRRSGPIGCFKFTRWPSKSLVLAQLATPRFRENRHLYIGAARLVVYIHVKNLRVHLVSVSVTLKVHPVFSVCQPY